MRVMGRAVTEAIRLRAEKRALNFIVMSVLVVVCGKARGGGCCVGVVTEGGVAYVLYESLTSECVVLSVPDR